MWFWLVVAVAVAAAGLAAYAFRALARREETIRRQLARETSLKARFDDVFERASDIMIVHDRRGRISTINRAGEHATGYSREEARNLDANWIFGSDYLDNIQQMLAEGADSAPRNFPSALSRRRGNRVPVDVHARVLVGDGQVVGVMAIAKDLTERERLQNELRQAQKMEAVGRLATGIAHDFNNLITVLIGYADDLLDNLTEGTDAHHAATSVRHATERASALTQQLLAFSRRQTNVSNAVDLNRIVKHMDDMLRRLIGPEIRLQASLAPGLSAINADESQIGQVIMNLAVNARDAMPKGGTLTIETANVDLGVENLDVIPGPHVMLCVSDTGLGMTAEVRDRLFEPFFTTKETGHGTGLGLSMVQAIVRQCGGHIMVDSAPGKGTKFLVYFPRATGAAEAPAAPLPPRGAAAVRGEGVVLLVEDDVSVRRLVVAELTRRGFTVIEAEDGRAALELYRRDKDVIDVVVTDIVMPRLNGADLAKEIEKIRPGQKVLFISGHPERAGAGLDPTGITNLLMKPFTADTLAARIKELIVGRTEVDGWSA
ncbi:MAG TPA: ATP-binding protein [Vicinamibacterales bacterium]|nr:ATP-binding protein [Vicinamibacterales bacterium]